MTELEQIELLERIGQPIVWEDDLPADPRWILNQLIDDLQPRDSYGVYGSDFTTCHCCTAGGSPYRVYEHTPECPVGRAEMALERFYEHQYASFEFSDGSGI